jgi:peptide deformylase
VATAEQPTRAQFARREAALAKVRKLGDPVLRSRARPVAAVDSAVAGQIRAMTRLLEDAMEAGLAATQLGILNRVFVYRLDEGGGDDATRRPGPVRALVNPELEWASEGTAVVEEACLSIPGVWIPVERPRRRADARARRDRQAGHDRGGGARVPAPAARTRPPGRRADARPGDQGRPARRDAGAQALIAVRCAVSLNDSST